MSDGNDDGRVRFAVTCYPVRVELDTLGGVEVQRMASNGALYNLGELTPRDLERLAVATAIAMVAEQNLEHRFCTPGVCTHCDFVMVLETLISSRETAPIARVAGGNEPG